MVRHSDVRPASAAEAVALAASLEQNTEALPRFSWLSVDALTDGRGVCLHRGATFPRDWVREVWIVAAKGEWLAAARRFCSYLFASGARQLRFFVAQPVDARHEAVWARYGARGVAMADNVLTVALDDPTLPYSALSPWPRTVYLGSGVVLGRARYSDIALIAAWSQEPRFYQALGRARGSTTEELFSRVLPDNPRYHARSRIHIYTVRRHAVPVGVIFEHQRDYDNDSVRELDMVLNDETLPPRTWAALLASTMDICFRRGATRAFVNVREEFPGMAQIFGADEATPWSTETSIKRTHYTATAEQFYASLAAKRFLRQHKHARTTNTPLLHDGARDTERSQ